MNSLAEETKKKMALIVSVFFAIIFSVFNSCEMKVEEHTLAKKVVDKKNTVNFSEKSSNQKYQ